MSLILFVHWIKRPLPELGQRLFERFLKHLNINNNLWCSEIPTYGVQKYRLMGSE